MNSSYIVIFLLLFIIFYEQKKNNVISKIIQNRHTSRKDKNLMNKLAQNFIGKECIVYAINYQVQGLIKEVSDSAILLESKDSTEAVNFDFIVRIREYPKSKNGKKKSVVLD